MKTTTETRAPVMRALKAVGFCVAIWLVTLAAFFTYFHDYNEPADVFWDENYHLTSAEKYLNGVFFLETHPPMGKFFLALGEWILEPNGDLDKSDLLTVDKLEEDLPNGFSFYGYRFFPAVMAFLNAPLLFIAFFKLSRSTILSALLTVPYVFDNALVVHFRGAMLDAMQVFFILLAILCFLFAFSRKQFDWKYVGLAILFGIFTGMAAMTKENGLILCVLGGVIAIRLRHWKKIAIASSGFLAGVAIPVFLGWYLHFNLGERFATDYEYEMSESAAAIVHRGEAGELRNFFQLFCEANAYIYYDNEGVPVLDDFDEDENGSWWYMWPFGGRSINYRWMTEDRESYHYLYLQCNPVIWFSVFLAVVLSVAMFLMRIFGEHRFSSPDREWMFGAFLALYVCYMAAMAWVSTERVLYLYHYFLALVFGFFLLALCVLEIQKFFKWEVGIKSRVAFMAVLSGAMIASFVYYSPLTYYKPMLDQEVEKRALLHHWHLRPEEH